MFGLVIETGPKFYVVSLTQYMTLRSRSQTFFFYKSFVLNVKSFYNLWSGGGGHCQAFNGCYSCLAW